MRDHINVISYIKVISCKVIAYRSLQSKDYLLICFDAFDGCIEKCGRDQYL